MKRHRSTLHELMQIFNIKPHILESIPTTGRNPATAHKCPFKIDIADNKEDSITADAEGRELSRTHISFSVFCVGVLIIRYDKMVSHMMPTCAFVFVIKACDPGKDLPYKQLDMCML
jgi:hypothetical protein